jgi:hypothetical protein
MRLAAQTIQDQPQPARALPGNRRRQGLDRLRQLWVFSWVFSLSPMSTVHGLGIARLRFIMGTISS